jgi:hypothetical protein
MFWLFAMKIFLFLGGASLFLSAALNLWNTDIHGTRIEVMLLGQPRAHAQRTTHIVALTKLANQSLCGEVHCALLGCPLDAVVFNMSGCTTLALFAFNKTMISPVRPLKRWIRRRLQLLMRRTESVPVQQHL